MTRARLNLVFLFVGLAVLAGLSSPSIAEDAASDFPGGGWTYGWKPVRTGTFTEFTNAGTDAAGQNYRNNPASQAGVYYNGTLGSVSLPGNTVIPPKTMSLYPGTGGEYAAVRWTAEDAGTYLVRARFIARSNNWAAKDVAVVWNSSVVFSRWLEPFHLDNGASMSALLALTPGETVDFVVGPADGSNFADFVGLDATVNLVPPDPGTAGPVLTFGGERFVPCRWEGPIAESIAFDPINRRLAGSTDISDLCGNRISDGPNEAPGLAWDLRTETYWQIQPVQGTEDYVVRRWTAAGALLDTVFTIPGTINVPGTGPDTLESVRGIAVDSNFVYIVDAGPDPGEIPSNAWFKFTRAGVPVKSSKSTDLLAHLDADPDALVDDIVYVPFSAPYFRGRLLIPLEHSGIQVVDTEGDFVDKFRWSTAGLIPARGNYRWLGKVSAFAGLAIDPATGNLYLVDNDTGNCQVWTRIADQGATAVVVGTAGGVLQLPNPGCNLPLWNRIASPPPGEIDPDEPSNFFGAAYRAADLSVYTCEFNTGELWRFDGRSGQGSRVGHTGVGALWGVAYDTERGALYGGQDLGSGTRVVTIDPVSGAASPLTATSTFHVSDLAFIPSDHALYGINTEQVPARLIRIDRDTGAGTVVGPTVPGRGIDYDPLSGMLIAIEDNRLFRIAPATGVAETLAVLAQSHGWEGLAVIPVPANTGTVSVGDPESAAQPPELRAWPNPARGSSTIEFALPHAAEVQVRIFDVAGRLVRDVRSGRSTPGPHRVEWDGRDASGNHAASGLYFVRVESGAHAMVTRLTRVR